MDAPFEILESIANGDQASFKKLYYLFCNNVYNIALSYTKNEEQAEEIVQDVFTKIYQNADKFKGNSTISTWIYRITCLLYTSPSPRDQRGSRMPSSA